VSGRLSKLSLVIAVAGVLTFSACASHTPAQGTSDVSLQPISSTGADPFMPPAGTNSTNVTPPPNTGGTVAGNAVGLFGGTLNQSTCDAGKMIAFLQAHSDKAAAWAAVLGIQPGDIPKFIGELTPAILRSDTFVINHGFANGHATDVPSVLQAGTAVLVNAFGFPVTRCFCGNPLTKPTVFIHINFTGPRWTTFSTTNITVIQSTTVVVNQFTMVEPTTNVSFDRPRGTDGQQDTNVTQPSTTGPPPISPAPSPVPPTTTAPPGSPPGSPGAPVVPPPGQPPTSAKPATPTPTPASPGPQSPTPQPVAPASPSPSGPSPKATPTPSPTPPPTTSRTPSPTASPSPSPSAERSNASWVVGDCFVDNGTLHATVLVRNNNTKAKHSYQATVVWGPTDNPFATKVAPLDNVQPGQTAQADVTTPAAPPAPTSGIVPCAITKLVDESGQTPEVGPGLPPPTPSPTPSPTTEPPTTAPSSTEPAPTTESPTSVEPIPS
jgi:hypothetical protein